MRKQTSIQQVTINKLLDKYERSKTFTGTNQVNQSFAGKIGELFPRYQDDAEYDFFCDVNEALKKLEKEGLVCLRIKRGSIVEEVILNTDRLEDCYRYANREPKKEAYRWLLETMEQFAGSGVLDDYFAAQRIKIEKNQKVEYFDGNKEEYRDLLKLIIGLLENEEEQFIRDFSIRQFGDSKRVEQLASRAAALLYQYGDYQDKDAVLEECGVVKTPTYLCLKGKAVLTLGEQTIDLSRLKGDLALSTASLKELVSVRVTGNRVVTVENLTSFHDYGSAEDFVIYLGGFHNRTKRAFLQFLYQRNEGKEYRHFGDIDAGGFYILEHLKEKTGIDFRSMHMDVASLRRYSHLTRPLTGTDRKRIQSLLDMQEKKLVQGTLQEDYRDVLRFMLEHDCKLEQEAVGKSVIEKEK